MAFVVISEIGIINICVSVSSDISTIWIYFVIFTVIIVIILIAIMKIALDTLFKYLYLCILEHFVVLVFNNDN